MFGHYGCRDKTSINQNTLSVYTPKRGKSNKIRLVHLISAQEWTWTEYHLFDLLSAVLGHNFIFMMPISLITQSVSTWSLLLLVVWSSHPTAADFKYERNIAFSVERVNPLGSSTDLRVVGGFNGNSQQLYLNIGDALDLTSGHFTAPLDGIYAFYYSFSSTMMGATTQLELFKVEKGKRIDQDLEEATPLVKQTLAPSVSSSLDSASASVMVDLARDDRVIMRLAPGLLDATRFRPLLYTGFMVYRTNDHVYGS